MIIVITAIPIQRQMFVNAWSMGKECLFCITVCIGVYLYRNVIIVIYIAGGLCLGNTIYCLLELLLYPSAKRVVFKADSSLLCPLDLLHLDKTVLCIPALCPCLV